MEHRTAVDLIRGAVPAAGGAWADIGAGSGTFTRALAELLGRAGVVHAVDRAAAPVSQAATAAARIVGHQADFTGPLALPALDGLLLANSLHFVRDQAGVLRGLLDHLRSGGRLVLVEYDQRGGSPWVPFPVPPSRFRELAAALGLEEPKETGRTPSRFGSRDIYCAVALRPEPMDPGG